MGSINGTLLNGNQIHNAKTYLKNNDIIQFGKCNININLKVSKIIPLELLILNRRIKEKLTLRIITFNYKIQSVLNRWWINLNNLFKIRHCYKKNQIKIKYIIKHNKGLIEILKMILISSASNDLIRIVNKNIKEQSKFLNFSNFYKYRHHKMMIIKILRRVNNFHITSTRLRNGKKIKILK